MRVAKVVRTMLAGWLPLLSLVVLLSGLSTVQAQDSGKVKPKDTDKNAAVDKAKPDKTKADDKAKTEDKTKPSPDLEKAQADVKKLEADLQKQREQMMATVEKLHQARAQVARLGGHEAGAGEHHHGPMAGFGWGGWRGHRGEFGAMRGPGPWFGWHHFGGPGAFFGQFGPGGTHGPGHGAPAAASSDLEKKVDKLQQEVDQLRHDLEKKK